MKKHLLNTLLFLLLVLGIGAVLLHMDMRQHMQQELKLSRVEKLLVEPGMSLQTIAYLLVDKKWLSHPHYLVFEGRRSGLANSIKAGEYLIEPGTTPAQLLDILVEGKVLQYSLTLLEGWSVKQVMQAIESSPHLRQSLQVTEPKVLMQALGYPDEMPEGMFFPDTYYFPKGTSDIEFLKRAYRTMQDILQEEWAARDSGLPYQSAYEALIMASIIEKETAVPDEYQIIAGVFVRRLQLRMKLQTDPTVIYAMGENYDGNIRRRDLSIDSPYNTYRYRGLPPTPIAIPGRAAIHAALHPAPGKSLYFVAKGDGSHYFSETLQEHNRAVAQYQLNKNK